MLKLQSLCNRKRRRIRKERDILSGLWVLFVTGLHYHRLLCNGFDPVGTLRFSSNCLDWPVKGAALDPGWKTCWPGCVGLSADVPDARFLRIAWILGVNRRIITTREQSWNWKRFIFSLREMERCKGSHSLARLLSIIYGQALVVHFISYVCRFLLTPFALGSYWDCVTWWWAVALPPLDLDQMVNEDLGMLDF